MIKEKEYMKSVNEMDAKEKTDYLDRVNRWTSDTFPELLALASCWESVPVKDFDEGCRLVSSITNARPFLQSIQRYEAKRAIKILNIYLEKVRVKSGLAGMKVRPAGEKKHFRAVVPPVAPPDEGGEIRTKEYPEEGYSGQRPKEFALYKDRLPKDLRERGEKEIPDMYLELADYRGRLEAMADNPNITDEPKREMAEKVLAAEQRIRAFWNEVDAFINRGQSGEEDNAASGQEEYYANMAKRPGEYTFEEIENMQDASMKDACRKARIEFDKKYINRADVKLSENYREQLEIRVKELMKWGETLPKKTIETLNAAGVKIPGVNIPYNGGGETK